ncbi:hypothetical protein [Salinibacter ruber]|uniref:hypothetical protein n=1 Tax=Salinibacter ruber TaxID=146919 RepID=UPI002073DF80|nr:hypothetical protein [Salinibacter ruber]
MLLAPRSAGPCPRCADEKRAGEQYAGEYAGEERPEKPKMEDRAEAPSIDVMDVLPSDLTSCRIGPPVGLDLLSDLTQKQLGKLHERTAQQAGQEVQAGQEIPNQPEPVKQPAALQRMKTLRGNLQ